MSSVEQFHLIREHIEEVPQKYLEQQYRSLSNHLKSLDDDIIQLVLQEAQQSKNPVITWVWVQILADSLYLPALPFLVKCLDKHDAKIRMIAAIALDYVSGHQFNISPNMEYLPDNVRIDIKQWWWNDGSKIDFKNLQLWERVQQTDTATFWTPKRKFRHNPNTHIITSPDINYLQHVFSSKESDLLENRKGRLSANQTKRLSNQNLRTTLVLHFVILFGVYSLLINITNYIEIPSFVGLVVTIPIYIFFIVILEPRNLNKRAMKSVSSIIKKQIKTNVGKYNSTIHVIRVNNLEFSVRPRQFYGFIDEWTYTIYYLENPLQIISVE